MKSLASLKREAHDMKAASNGTMTHMQCLEAVAKKYGWKSYAAAKHELEPR